MLFTVETKKLVITFSNLAHLSRSHLFSKTLFTSIFLNHDYNFVSLIVAKNHTLCFVLQKMRKTIIRVDQRTFKSLISV